jgi:hypothetical protein
LYVMINDYLMAFYHVQQLLRTEWYVTMVMNIRTEGSGSVYFKGLSCQTKRNTNNGSQLSQE